MKNLLENDLPAFYGVGRRCTCDEIRTTSREFDLTEDDTQLWLITRQDMRPFAIILTP